MSRAPKWRMSFRRLEFLLAACAVFLAPLDVLRLDVVYITASDTFFVLALFCQLATRGLPRTPFGWATPAYYCAFSLMAGSLLLSSIVNGDPARGVIVFAQYEFAYLVIPLVLVGQTFDGIIRLIRVYIASVAVMALHGIYVIHIVGQTMTRYVSGNGRLEGLVEGANACGAVMAMTLPFVIWTTRRGHLPVLVGAAAYVLILYGIMLTGSNSGLFAAMFASALVIVVTGRVQQSVLLFGTLALGGVAVITFASDYLPAAFQHRVLGALTSGNIAEAGTFEGRMELALEAFELSRQTWLLGFGADQYRLISIHGAPVHNLYLLLWTEGGFPCLAGWLGMIVTLVAGAVFVRRRLPDPSPTLAAACVIVAFAFFINSIPHVYGRFWSTPVFLAFALALAAQRAVPAPATPAARRVGRPVPAARAAGGRRNATRTAGV